MTQKRLASLRRRVQALRRSQAKARELHQLALQLGRKRVNRGKHPMYESGVFRDLWPLSIPDHKGRDMPTGTKESILNQLEEDLDAWDAALSTQERGNGSGPQR
jgi:hypothetical protein